MPASRPSRYKDRYDKLLDDSLAIVQARDFSAEELAQTAEDAFKRVPGAVMVPIDRIEPNPENPRQGMDETSMEILATSIAERGLLQPLVVRRDSARPGYYVVIAGSRRLLAARIVHGDPDETVRARVAHLPSIIKETSDSDAFADALLENLARADLSRAETMDALLRLHKDYGWSGNKIARRTGRSQGDVSELLAIAQDAELADLVRADRLRPSAAAIIKRMPQEIRQATLDDVRRGDAPSVEEVKRRYQTAMRPALAAPAMPEPEVAPSPASHDSGVRVSNSIPAAAATQQVATPTSPAAADAESENAAQVPHDDKRVSTSISSHVPPSTGGPLPAGSRDDRRGDVSRESLATAIASVREQAEAIGALAAMVDAGTSTGEAVLSAVRRDLAAAYDKLAAYVKKRDQRDNPL